MNPIGFNDGDYCLTPIDQRLCDHDYHDLSTQPPTWNYADSEKTSVYYRHQTHCKKCGHWIWKEISKKEFSQWYLNKYSNQETEMPSEKWLEMSKEDRMKSVDLYLNEIKVVDAKNDGQVIVELRNQPSARYRSTLLLDYEREIKIVDPSLTVWLESMGDKSSLRNLRGIEVKSL